jgi:hypothetical protein
MAMSRHGPRNAPAVSPSATMRCIAWLVLEAELLLIKQRFKTVILRLEQVRGNFFPAVWPVTMLARQMKMMTRAARPAVS